ncbi:histone-lysine N-methyltransferase setd3-like isoform X2 [Varroa destructor]|uniref:protein-histidine N-methyltransferase n=1 Tax=Varroa destructor TaxID=109461 RepID=A0A7M7JUI6_VARDE|nr:histone-lysine N-methyltransferase setd3-like isoform X2 [Varroa destructor]
MGKHKNRNRSATITNPETAELIRVIDKIFELTVQDVNELSRDLLENFGRIRTLVERARCLEKKFDEVPVRSETAMRELVDWGIRRGCFVRGIQLRRLKESTLDEYGVFCTDSLQDSDIFLSVPLDLMLTSDHALERSGSLSPLLRNDAICSHMSNVCLSLLLLNELAKNEQSFWHKYISCLPAHYSTILYFNEDEMRLLSGSATLEEACKLYRSIARQYAYFKKKFLTEPKWRALPAMKIFTYEAYRWACSTVMTRQNQVPSLTPGRMQTALIPLWDMCNHDTLRSGTDYDVPSQQLVSFATRAYVKDEEVCIFYGNRGNAQFFLHNGFVPQTSNPWDNLPLRLGLSRSDKLFEIKRRLCEQMKIPISSTFELKKNPDGNGVLVPKLLLHLVHVLQWKPEHSNKSETKAKASDNRDNMDNNILQENAGTEQVEEEEGVRTKKAISFLQTRCSLLMKTLPKSEEKTSIPSSTLRSDRINRQVTFGRTWSICNALDSTE